MLQYPVANPAYDYALPETVTTIADMAMTGSAKISRLTLPVSLTTIGAYSLYGCSGLKRVISLNPEPPAASDGIFGSLPIFETSTYRNATLYVNESDLDVYRTNAEWGKFASIEPIDPAGIEDAGAEFPVVLDGNAVRASDGGPIDVYDLAGHCVARGQGAVELTARGVYIVVTSGYRIKVFI